ncbi:hypothetical protein [Mycobacterium bourgelatii]|uniref:Uncharacterized protein n=1 Tax=Mycobacterium bourgelatii TaxID=1273442 RepID=A0A7I9YL91_MYCBU|nr:hypothetical protein [Mycobacterium bourgelatii]MCV6977985.1 hypothetical protein [Mycobacterium bourgelatii]GFG89399.1 hypothetical protein MBOU_14410 [Mycobacterium bourgelatii]
MISTTHHHDGTELFDLRFLHARQNIGFCRECENLVDLGDPAQVGSLWALAHRVLFCRATGIYWSL